MRASQNAIRIYQQLLLEVGDRLLEHLRSIALEVAAVKQHLIDASSVEHVRESVDRAIVELDRAEHDLRGVLATVALNNAAAPEPSGDGDGGGAHG